MSWTKGIAEWTLLNDAYVSVPFTWLLQRAYSRCVALGQTGYHVRAGGPAVFLRPDILSGVAEIGGDVDALQHHNPDATMTSRGCSRQCAFCAVPRSEGTLRELETWEPKPIVCDNNLLACSRKHFDRVIDSLKGVPGVDFNQGLDARLLTPYHAGRLAELDLQLARVAWDDVRDEAIVMGAVGLLKDAGIPKGILRSYVLIGFEDTPADAWYRLEVLKAAGIRPNVMRYEPLTAMQRGKHVGPHWTDRELKRFSRFWNRQAWLGGVDFADYKG